MSTASARGRFVRQAAMILKRVVGLYRRLTEKLLRWIEKRISVAVVLMVLDLTLMAQ